MASRIFARFFGADDAALLTQGKEDKAKSGQKDLRGADWVQISAVRLMRMLKPSAALSCGGTGMTMHLWKTSRSERRRGDAAPVPLFWRATGKGRGDRACKASCWKRRIPTYWPAGFTKKQVSTRRHGRLPLSQLPRTLPERNRAILVPPFLDHKRLFSHPKFHTDLVAEFAVPVCQMRITDVCP